MKENPKKTGFSLESLNELLFDPLPVPLGAPLCEPLSVLTLNVSFSVLLLSVLPLREFREPMRPKPVLLVPYLFQVFP